MKSNVMYNNYEVKLDSSCYNILLGRDLLPDSLIENLNSKTKNKKVLIVFDPYFEDLVKGKVQDALTCAQYQVHTHLLKSGKHNKTIISAIGLYEFLEIKGFSRDSTIIAFGGGVIGDLVGFVASTYLRGVNFISIPTTLMAMIDSSIGGKVAINFRKTINAIGNYYHPMLDVIDFDFIKSLSDRDFRSGLAEIIKCAVIADKELFAYLDVNSEKVLSRQQDALLYIMSRAIEIKLDHVSGDVREQGKRLRLNYGHTLGHSVEISTDVLSETYRHGEGVSIGMIGAAYIAVKYFGKSDNILREHEAILKKYGLPTRVDSKAINFRRQDLIDECVRNVYKDKKKKNSQLRFVLPQVIGECGVYGDVSDDLVAQAFNYLIRS
ncbi:MAG: 3-dehydroquinate synthase [Candidatus Omnitrophica bacterium]|nr:3-dehydroquinate synthase [Candidatus Omnitrophota bacterium]